MTEAIERNGIYGANILFWTEDQWRLVELGRFKWAVVRTDTDPSVAKRCRDLGIKVIMQMPDRFNQGDWPQPAFYAEVCHKALKPFENYSALAVLDNEPNRIDSHASPWFAEEFCRWYRAMVAEFRYQDSSGPWELIHPAMAHTPLLGADYWLEVNRENIRESRGIGVHSYWYTREQLDAPYWGGSWRQVREMYPGQDIYILEYGQLSTTGAVRTIAENEQVFVRGLEDPVQCACRFILGGTQEWRSQWLSESEARALAGV